MKVRKNMVFVGKGGKWILILYKYRMFEIGLESDKKYGWNFRLGLEFEGICF